jgi:hypothetical protein
LLSNGFAWAPAVTSIPQGKAPENVAEAVSAASVRALETRFAVLCALKYFDGYRLPDFMVAESAWETLASSF